MSILEISEAELSSAHPTRRPRRWNWVASAVFALLVLVFAAAPALPLHAPLSQDLANPFGGPGGSHWLGQDNLGRDVLSRVIWGGRTSLVGMVAAVGFASLLGIPWGLCASFFGGWIDGVLMRVADGVLSVPGIVLAIAIVGVLHPSILNAMLAIGFVFSPTVARLMRAQTLPLMRADFMSAARLIGASRWRSMWVHAFPNAMGPVLVQLCSLASIALIAEASLSFLGLATQPPAPSWGGDLATAYTSFNESPWGTLVPGLSITVVAFLVSLVGNELRQKLGVR